MVEDFQICRVLQWIREEVDISGIRPRDLAIIVRSQIEGQGPAFSYPSWCSSQA
jgi:hypothetical protein